MNLNYPPPATAATFFPYGTGEGSFQLIPAEAFAPHPFARIPKTFGGAVNPSPQPPITVTPIKLTDARGRPASLTQGRKQKKPKRVMSAPYVQAVQQPNKQFKVQKMQVTKLRNVTPGMVKPAKLVQLPKTPARARPATPQRQVAQQQQQQSARLQTPVEVQLVPLQLQAIQPVQAVQPVQYQPQQFAPLIQQDASQFQAILPEQPVLVTASGSTAADQPIARSPVLPTGTASYPFYGVPTTDNRDEASLILEPNSKAISGNGGTAISTPVSHAILKHGSSTKILFRPQSVAIVGANGRAHAQADLIVDYVN